MSSKVGFITHNIFAGIALLGANTDMNEERSLTFENDITDIYSNSWGPPDDGNVVAGPGQLAKMALEIGVREVSFYWQYFIQLWLQKLCE